MLLESVFDLSIRRRCRQCRYAARDIALFKLGGYGNDDAKVSQKKDLTYYSSH